MQYRKTFAAGCALLTAVSISTTAHADTDNTRATYVGTTPQDVGVMDIPRPEYDAKGIPVGDFRLFPTLDLLANYDDNVFRQRSGESDYFFSVSPAFRLKSEWDRNFLEFYGGLNNYDYAKLSGQDLTDWRIGADGRYDISRAAMATANVYYGEMHEIWEAPNNLFGFQAAPNRYYQTHADLSGTYQPNRLGIGFGGSFDRYDWTQTPEIGGGLLDNGDRNEDEVQGYGKIFYDFSPGYSGFLKATYDGRHFDQMFDRNGLDRSSQGYHLDSGLDLQITHLLQGEVFVGYVEQRFPQSVPTPLHDLSALDYSANLNWFALPILTVHLYVTRMLIDTTLPGVSFADNNMVMLSADYELQKNIILQPFLGTIDTGYIGVSRNDSLPSGGLGIKYLLNNDMSAVLNYRHSERSSNVSEVDFNDNTLSVGLSLRD